MKIEMTSERAGDKRNIDYHTDRWARDMLEKGEGKYREQAGNLSSERFAIEPNPKESPKIK